MVGYQATQLPYLDRIGRPSPIAMTFYDAGESIPLRLLVYMLVLWNEGNSNSMYIGRDIIATEYDVKLYRLCSGREYPAISLVFEGFSRMSYII
jgi:hypothetical protein